MENKINGISCEVQNCVHHDMSNNCTAGHIVVGNQTAKSVTETKCETFKCCDTDCCK